MLTLNSVTMAISAHGRRRPPFQKLTKNQRLGGTGRDVRHLLEAVRREVLSDLWARRPRRGADRSTVQNQTGKTGQLLLGFGNGSPATWRKALLLSCADDNVAFWWVPWQENRSKHTKRQKKIKPQFPVRCAYRRLECRGGGGSSGSLWALASVWSHG